MSKAKGATKWSGPPRSNTGGSVKGKLISNPIPITDDDEFPIRTPGAGIATPLGAEGFDSQPNTMQRVSGSFNPLANSTGVAVSSFEEQPKEMPGTKSSPEAPIKQTNKPSMLRHSVISEAASSSGKPERKKSGLRSAFRRLFGKSKGGVSSPTDGTKSPGNRADQHLSDPVALRSSKGGPAGPIQKRSASLPINEYNRALRSHSVVLDDIPRNSGSTKRDSGPTAAETQGRPRGATTPSKASGYVDWTGLSPRPASSHPRGGRIVSNDGADAAIGTAITSESHQRRRSRSVGEWRDASSGAVATRRRSDEIRYWRESYEPGVLSPTSAKPDSEEPIVLEDENKENERPGEAPQPFNFGPLGELAGMKITQAAGLEARIRKLEDRCYSMERIIYPRTTSLGSTLRLQDPPKRHSNTRNSPPRRQPAPDGLDFPLPRYPRNRTPPKETFQEAPYSGRIRSSSTSYGSNKITNMNTPTRPSTLATNSSYYPSLDISTSTLLLPRSSQEVEHTPRPLSTQTTTPGLPSISTTTLTVETLLSLLLSEQAARQDLEALVRSLQQQLATLKSQTVAPPTSYPTPDSDRNRHSNPLQRSLDSESGEDRDGRSTSIYSTRDANPDSDDEFDAFNGNEIFRTPDEGAFGERVFGGEREKRTLSLSQMTVGKGRQPSVNF